MENERQEAIIPKPKYNQQKWMPEFMIGVIIGKIYQSVEIEITKEKKEEGEIGGS